MTWLEERLGITNAEASRILAVSRRAEDSDDCQRALVASVVNGVATVQRWNWKGERMLDYLVRVKR